MCAQVDECTFSEYESKGPTETTDRECSPVAVCVADQQFESVAPTETSDRECSTYKDCSADGAAWQYEPVAPTGEADRECAPVTPCTASEFETIPPSLFSDRVCMPLEVCESDEFEAAAPTATTDRMCQEQIEDTEYCPHTCGFETTKIITYSTFQLPTRLPNLICQNHLSNISAPHQAP
jgi:hypothetical protein